MAIPMSYCVGTGLNAWQKPFGCYALGVWEGASFVGIHSTSR
jgi:hypothetical protein